MLRVCRQKRKVGGEEIGLHSHNRRLCCYKGHEEGVKAKRGACVCRHGDRRHAYQPHTEGCNVVTERSLNAKVAVTGNKKPRYNTHSPYCSQIAVVVAVVAWECTRQQACSTECTHTEY